MARAENVFTTGLNALAMGNKRLRIRLNSHDRASEPNAGTRLVSDSAIDVETSRISKDTVHTIIRQVLRKRKICSRFFTSQADRQTESKSDGHH